MRVLLFDACHDAAVLLRRHSIGICQAVTMLYSPIPSALWLLLCLLQVLPYNAYRDAAVLPRGKSHVPSELWEAADESSKELKRVMDTLYHLRTVIYNPLNRVGRYDSWHRVLAPLPDQFYIDLGGQGAAQSDGNTAPALL